MKKTLLVSLCALFVALAGVSAQAATLKLSHVRPQGSSVDKDMTTFAQEVEKATAGKIKIRLYAANALGDYTVVQERLSIGALDMACQPVATAADKRLQISSLPYLVETWAEAEKSFGPGGVLREAVAGLLAEQNILVIGAWPVYFSGIALNKEPSDPLVPGAKKNAKLRIPPWKSLSLVTEAMGYQGAPLPFSEAFTAVQTGVVDGVMGSGAEGYYSSFRDVTKFYVPVNLHFEVWFTLIAKETFDGLSKAQQDALIAAATALETERWKTAPAETAAFENKLAENGTKIIPVSDAQLAAFGKMAREKVWPEVLSDMGKEWTDGLLEKMGKK